MVLKMSDPVTPQYLLKGAVYSLEQCGVLLCDAVVLYRRNAYASAVVLAAYAWEALGQWKILLDLRKQVIGGQVISIREIKSRCGDHIQKQRAGMSTVTMQADQDSRLGQLLMSRMRAAGTEEWQKIDEEFARLDRQMQRSLPSQRHQQRELALYVDPIEPLSADRWNRPSAQITRVLAQRIVRDAINDYSGQLENRYNNLEILRNIDQELCTALEQWSDRPTLPLPEGPPPP
jgi:AbiV family abortive infection protein